MEIVAESLAERRKKGERTAAEQDRSLETDAVRKRYHRLYGDGMEDAGCNIRFGQIARHQVLDVGFGEHAAAGSHRINVLCLHRQFAHLLVFYAHQHTHLVDESTRSAGTVAVHAQFHISVFLEEDNLRILAANIDERLSLRMSRTGIDRCSHHLLYKLRLELFGSSHSYASRYADSCLCIAREG